MGAQTRSRSRSEGEESKSPSPAPKRTIKRDSDEWQQEKRRHSSGHSDKESVASKEGKNENHSTGNKRGRSSRSRSRSLSPRNKSRRAEANGDSEGESFFRVRTRSKSGSLDVDEDGGEASMSPSKGGKMLEDLKKSGSRSGSKCHAPKSLSRSRSRSRSRSKNRRSRRSRSRSYSPRRRGDEYERGNDEDGYRLHVADLDINASKKDLEKVFGKYGPLKEIWMARSIPCFAFIVYRYKDDAGEAVRKTDGMDFCGRRIRVSTARPRTRGMGRRGFDPSMRCYQCGDRGHFSRDCPDSKYGYKRPPSPRGGRYYPRNDRYDSRRGGDRDRRY